jgi:starch-binding outer membrane protein, SusD/RagB family
MKHIISLALVILFFGSCSKLEDEFLTRKAAGLTPENEALTDEASLQRLLNGAYIYLANDVYGGRLQFISDLMGDQANGILYTEDFGEIYKRKTSIFGGFKNGFFQNAYRVNAQANRALARLDLASANKDNIEGQAKFLRGIIHFEMVRLFAQPWGSTTDNSHLGVPLRLSSEVTPGTRATVKEVYDAIIADLKDAEIKLPDNPAIGYPSKWAAKAFLAKVYFQQNNFAEAFNYADQVIKSNNFSLDADHSKRFSLNAGTTGTKEGIFIMKSITNVLTPGGELREHYRSDGSNFQSQSDFHLTDVVYNLATQSNDLRKAWYEKNSNGFNVIKKYNLNEFDLPIVHYTEIKLIRAEAGAETGGANLAVAITDINDILTRAYGGTSQNLASTASAALVISTTRTQRELEMMAEGNRLQEIKRIGVRTATFTDRRGAIWNCPGMVLQFPSAEQGSNTGFPLNPEGGCL